MIRLYYGFQLFFSLLLWAPIFYDYQRKIGLSDPEIFGIQSIYYIAFCLLEIPTGYLADRIGHRSCLRAGAVTLVLAGLFPIFGPIAGRGYAGMLAHFLLIALSRSLVSGAASAYLYDYLAARGELARYKEIEGNGRAYGLLAKVVFWAGIGALMEWRLDLPYWLTLVASATAVGFALKLPAAADSARASRKLEPRELVAAFRASPMLPWIMIQGVALFVVARIVALNLFQPLLSQKGFGVASYGIVMAAMTAAEALGSSRLSGGAWLSRRMSDLNAVFLLSVLMIASLLGMGSAGGLGTVASLAFFSYVTGLAYPIQRKLMNDAIPDSRFRATLLSVESIVDRAFAAGVAATVGGFVATGRITEFLSLSAGASAVGVFGVALVLRLRMARAAVRA